MAGRGPAPKQRMIRPTDDKRRQSEFTHLQADGQTRGPELPEGDWPERTRELWTALRTSPMAATWLDVDWQNLIDIVYLHRAFIGGEYRWGPEIRLRLGQYGVTPEARLRLRLLVDPEEQPKSKLDELRERQEQRNATAARRRRLLKAIEADPSTSPAPTRKATP